MSDFFPASLDGLLTSNAFTEGASTLDTSSAAAFEAGGFEGKLDQGMFDALSNPDNFDAALLPTMELLTDDIPTDLSWTVSSRHNVPEAESPALSHPEGSRHDGEPAQRRSKRSSAHAARAHLHVRDSEGEDACSISSADNSMHGEDGDWQPESTALVTQEEVDTPASTTRRYNLEGNPKQRRRKPIAAAKQPWAKMSTDERKRQDTLRAERSRQSARDCRKRKKAYMLGLEKQVTMYKEKMLELQRAVENSHEENKRLQAENRLLRINLQQA